MFSRIPLLPKMLLLTLLVGALIWVPLDLFHTQRLAELMRAQQMAQLEFSAQEDRVYFDHFLRTYHQAARFFGAENRLSDYLDQIEANGSWQTDAVITPQQVDLPPPWLPRTSVLRIFPLPRFVLLLDSDEQVREIYASGETPPPHQLLHPQAILMQLSHSGVLMSNVGGIPYLLSSEAIVADDGRLRARLILATPLDSEFLRNAQKPGVEDHLTLLIRDDRVVASSRPDLIPEGETVATFKHHYMILGKSFFDYGVADLFVQFATVMSTSEVEALTRELRHEERRLRAFTAAGLLTAFLLIIIWVTRSVRRVTQQITSFSRQTLGVDPQELSGDELKILALQFTALRSEIEASRAALTEAVEERTRSELEAAQQAQMVALLRNVTDALGVGVLRLGPQPQPLNGVMERLFACCPTLFSLAEDEESAEREVIDANGRLRVFDLHRPLEEFLLVLEITEARETRQRLALALQAIEHTTEGVFVTEADGTAILVNPTLARLIGIDEEGTRQRRLPLLPLLTDDPQLRAEVEQGLAQTGSWEGDLTLHTDTGNHRLWLRLGQVQEQTSDTLHYVGVVSDITERHLATERLARYAEELQQANEEVKSFASILSHDLRSPLVNVKGFVGELRHAVTTLQPLLDGTQAEPLTPEQQQLVKETFSADIPEALDFIDASVRKMDRLIQAILTLSRLGRRELKPEPLPLGPLVEEQIESLRFQLERRQATITVGELPVVLADRTAMEQIFGNLIGNAVNYLVPERPGRITIRADEGVNEVQIHISDNGRGIDSADFPKVFAIFRRAGPQDVPGEGMGLAFVQTLVRRHGGRIWFQSALGVGSTFSIALPRQPLTSLPSHRRHAA